MLLDFAPMEGITGVLFRRFHHEYFPGVDRYYTPFLSPTRDHVFTPRELREILPENNDGIMLVPQILTKVPEDFLWAAKEVQAMGYEEVNLNAGCPSGTVTAKGKGAGMLADPQMLDRFLEEVFSQAPCKISVKTRLGMEEAEEFGPILEVYNKYPLSELIVHPRVRRDFYRYPVRLDAFDRAIQASKNPVSYNGGLVTAQDFASCVQRYPQVKAVMLGQGLVSDPFLAGKIKCSATGSKEVLKEFHDRLLDAYVVQFDSQLNAIRRMKELWVYLIHLFADSQRYGKKIMKAKHMEDYRTAVEVLFRDLELLDNSTGGWKPV